MHNIIQIQSVINPFLLFFRFLLIMTIVYVNNIMLTINTKSLKNKGFLADSPIYCDIFLRNIQYIGNQKGAFISSQHDCYLYNLYYGNVIIETNCSFLSDQQLSRGQTRSSV